MIEKEIICKLSIENKKEPKVKGVYFLVHNGDVVYVGQADDIFSRISSHRRNINMRFDRYFYIPYDSRQERESMELKYIEKFCPKYNIQDNPEAIQDMHKAISLMSVGDKNFYGAGKGNTLSWKLVLTIFKRHGIKTRFRSVNTGSMRLSEREVLYEKSLRKNSKNIEIVEK